MFDRSRLFNYLTLILAICTICSAIWSIFTGNGPIISIVFMLVMLIFSRISKKINENEIMLTNDKIVSNIENKAEEK